MIGQWLDGGFVENREETEDADITTLFDGPAYDSLDPGTRDAVIRLVSGPECKAAWLCDSYPIIVYSDAHPNHGVYVAMRGFWDEWWSRHKDSNEPKGYLEIR